MKSSFCIDLQRFMLIPTKFPLTPQQYYLSHLIPDKVQLYTKKAGFDLKSAF